MLLGLLAGVAGRRRYRAASTPALHPGGRAELRHHAGRPARLPGPAAATCSATTAPSTSRATRAWSQFAPLRFLADAGWRTCSSSLIAAVVPRRPAARRSAARQGRRALARRRSPLVVVKTALLAGGLGYLTYYLEHRPGLGLRCGCSSSAWSCVMDFVLRKSTWGRHLFAVGGNVEAARRSGIKVGPDLPVGVRAVLRRFAALGGLLVRGAS